MKPKRNRSPESGMTLLELLMAAAIASFFFLTLYASLAPGIRAVKTLHDHFDKYRWVRPFFLRFERDLRNMVACSSIPFTGMENACSFPVFHDNLARVSYFQKGTRLIREEGSESKTLIPNVRKFHLEYAYRDAENTEINFIPLWPDSGPRLPKALKVSLEWESRGEKERHSKIILIPQGRWGRIPVNKGKA